MAIQEAKLFSDVMQITRRQTSFDDGDGAISDVDSAIWVTSLGLACQELAIDAICGESTATGTTESYTVQSLSMSQITTPSDYWQPKLLYVDGNIISETSLEALLGGNDGGFVNQVDSIIMGKASGKTYNLYYYTQWPLDSGIPSTDLSIIPDNYYNSLLWLTCKYIYASYEEDQGITRSYNMYEMSKKLFRRSGVTLGGSSVGRP